MTFNSTALFTMEDLPMGKPVYDTSMNIKLELDSEIDMTDWVLNRNSSENISGLNVVVKSEYDDGYYNTDFHHQSLSGNSYLTGVQHPQWMAATPMQDTLLPVLSGAPMKEEMPLKKEIVNAHDFPTSDVERLLAWDGQLQFSSLEEAIASAPVPDWRCVSPDLSLPINDTERHQWVAQLLAAFNDTASCADRPTAAFRRRWVIEPPYYPPEDKEFVCWDILHLAESFHVDGPSAFISFKASFWKYAGRSQLWTFEERIQYVMELLRHSKARCDKLMFGRGLQRVVSNPRLLLMHTKGNARQNRKRQVYLEAGRKWKREHGGDAPASKKHAKQT